MSIAGGIMVPHPPLIVPEVGGGRESEIVKTSDAYRKAAAFAAALRPDTLIITSPHTVMYRDYFHISPGASASGDLSVFSSGTRTIFSRIKIFSPYAIIGSFRRSHTVPAKKSRNFPLAQAGQCGQKKTALP